MVYNVFANLKRRKHFVKPPIYNEGGPLGGRKYVILDGRLITGWRAGAPRQARTDALPTALPQRPRQLATSPIGNASGAARRARGTEGDREERGGGRSARDRHRGAPFLAAPLPTG